jgi:hypothetical protein
VILWRFLVDFGAFWHVIRVYRPCFDLKARHFTTRNHPPHPAHPTPLRGYPVPGTRFPLSVRNPSQGSTVSQGYPPPPILWIEVPCFQEVTGCVPLQSSLGKGLRPQSPLRKRLTGRLAVPGGCRIFFPELSQLRLWRNGGIDLQKGRGGLRCIQVSRKFPHQPNQNQPPPGTKHYNSGKQPFQFPNDRARVSQVDAMNTSNRPDDDQRDPETPAEVWRLILSKTNPHATGITAIATVVMAFTTICYSVISCGQWRAAQTSIEVAKDTLEGESSIIAGDSILVSTLGTISQSDLEELPHNIQNFVFNGFYEYCDQLGNWSTHYFGMRYRSNAPSSNLGFELVSDNVFPNAHCPRKRKTGNNSLLVLP